MRRGAHERTERAFSRRHHPPPARQQQIGRALLRRLLGATPKGSAGCNTLAFARVNGAASSNLSPARLALYDTKRNDPAVPDALSNLSPWLHFGQLSPQRAALEAAKVV